MNRFVAHTPASANGRAAEALSGIWQRHGSAGAMVRTMAGSPALLVGYLDLSRAMKRAKLDRRISERISLAVQDRLGCEFCLTAHTDAARSLGIDDDEIAAARRGTSADPRIAAMVRFGHDVHTEPGAITDRDLDELRALGFTDEEILDVVGLVALNVITGSLNLVAGLEPQPQLT
jgi:uncharacterized peroxidase-related enzyme